MKHLHQSVCLPFIIILLCFRPLHSQVPTLWSLRNFESIGGIDSTYIINNLFIINGDGTGYQNLITFPFDHSGFQPGYSAPVQASDGKLYGVLAEGGEYYAYIGNTTELGYGVIYGFDTGTSDFKIVHTFERSDGSYPFGSLLQASDGKLYGMCRYGNIAATDLYGGEGTIFSYDPSANIFMSLYDFDVTHGADPWGGLTETAGLLYGMTSDGGANGAGVIFRFDPVADTISILHNFSTAATDGKNPKGNLTIAPDGNLYGLTDSGGADGLGVLFRFNPVNDNFKVMHSFSGSNSGGRPYGSLTLATNGKLYGATPGTNSGYGTAFNYNIADSSLNTFYQFYQNEAIVFGGAFCNAPNGLLYGSWINSSTGVGTLFSINTSVDTLTTLYTYTDKSYYGSLDTNGCEPWGGVLFTGSKLYGMNGGCGSDYWKDFGGSFFTYDITDVRYNKLFDFGSYYADANYMIKGLDGNVYMTASGGGKNYYGLLLRYDVEINRLDTLTFIDDTLTSVPLNLTQLPDGMFYGISDNGYYTPFPAAYLFSYNPTTGIYSNLHYFDGGIPIAENSLIAVNNQLYGTFYGTIYSGSGMLYRFNPQTLVLDTLVNFSDSLGVWPPSNLVYDGNGKLYGITTGGGANSDGVIFCYNIPDSTYKVVFNFNNTLGGVPPTNIVMAPNGKIFGALSINGNTSGVFCFDPATDSCTICAGFNSHTGPSQIARLIVASDGNIYGSVPQPTGEIFELSPQSFALSDVADGYPGSLYLDMPRVATAVTENAMINKVTLYPNPSSNFLILQSESFKNTNAQPKVYDISGRLIAVKTEYAADKIILQTGNLANGLYLIKLKMGEGEINRKFIRQGQ